MYSLILIVGAKHDGLTIPRTVLDSYIFCTWNSWQTLKAISWLNWKLIQQLINK